MQNFFFSIFNFSSASALPETGNWCSHILGYWIPNEEIFEIVVPSSNPLTSLGNHRWGKLHTNGSFSNFGWNSQSLKERCFFWTLTCVTRGDKDVQRSHGTSLGRGFFLVTEQNISNFNKFCRCKHKSNISNNVW